jgi:type IV conjugative transfer system coupling protein TraD
MFKIALVAVLLVNIYLLGTNIKPNEWQLIPTIIVNEVVSRIDKDKYIKVIDKNNNKFQVRANNFYSNQYVKEVVNNFKSTIYKCITYSVYIIEMAFVIILIFFWFKGKHLNANNQLRGTFLITEKELKNGIKNHNRQFKDCKPYEVAGIPYAANGKGKAYTPGEQSHTLIIGATGTGKTKIIQHLVSQLQQRKQKAIITDIKGDYIKAFYNPARGDVILNPLDVRGANWNFFSEADILNGFDTIARTLIPDAGKDPFWVNAARRIFSEIAKLYWNENLSLVEFTDKILKSNLSYLEKILADTSAAHLVDQKADRTVACVLMMLAVYLAPLRLYTSNKDAFSITKWINDDNKNNFLFISTSAESKESLNPLVQIQIDIAINALCSSKKKSFKPIWFILDELQYFDRSLPNLKDGLATARSFGGCFVLGTQDISSLEKIYGYEESRIIANNCRSKVFMNVDDNYTAKWCSEVLGEGELEEWNEGLSYGSHEMRDGVSVHKNRTLRRVVLPSEFSQLKTGQGFIKIPGFQPAKFNFADCYFKDVSQGYIENKDLIERFRQELVQTQKKRKDIESLIQTSVNNFELEYNSKSESINKQLDLPSKTIEQLNINDIC